MTAVIPKDRVGVLVGPGGTVKSTIEEKLFVDLKIDSPSGAVEIGVKPHAPDPSGALQAKDIVVAIGRGFYLSEPSGFSPRTIRWTSSIFTTFSARTRLRFEGSMAELSAEKVRPEGFSKN